MTVKVVNVRGDGWCAIWAAILSDYLYGGTRRFRTRQEILNALVRCLQENMDHTYWINNPESLQEALLYLFTPDLCENLPGCIDGEWIHFLLSLMLERRILVYPGQMHNIECIEDLENAEHRKCFGYSEEEPTLYILSGGLHYQTILFDRPAVTDAAQDVWTLMWQGLPEGVEMPYSPCLRTTLYDDNLDESLALALYLEEQDRYALDPFPSDQHEQAEQAERAQCEQAERARREQAQRARREQAQRARREQAQREEQASLQLIQQLDREQVQHAQFWCVEADKALAWRM